MELEDNRAFWTSAYDWKARGDEWSGAWGGPSMQWYGSLLPRLHGFLPAAAAVEIAPGFGRWTQFLREHCRSLVAVDLSQTCVDACRARFAGDPRVTVHVNNGSSLPMVADKSVDLVFSFDSLVHVEADVLGAYAREAARVLTPEGVLFVHHSNLRRHNALAAVSRVVPGRVRKPLAQRGVLINLEAARAPSVDAGVMRQLCAAAGLNVIAQELVPWSSGPRIMDCITVAVRPGSRRDRPPRVWTNRGFMREAAHLTRLARHYGLA